VPVSTDPEPAGDYGYDLAHEGGRPPGRPAERTGTEPLTPGPGKPANGGDSGGDYGYDEAHGF
jgi:hypothetical protein